MTDMSTTTTMTIDSPEAMVRFFLGLHEFECFPGVTSVTPETNTSRCGVRFRLQDGRTLRIDMMMEDA